MLTGKKCNFCTYIVSGAPNGPPYMLTGKKCNFRTYIVIGAANGPLIHCYIGWLRKSAISAPILLLVLSDCWDWHFGPTLKLGHQRVPCKGWLLKFSHKLLAQVYHSATKWSPVQSDWWNCLSLAPFTTGPPKGPPYRLIVEMSTFWPHFVNGPHSGWLVKSFWT